MTVIAAMSSFVSEWYGQFAQVAQLEQDIKVNLRGLGYSRYQERCHPSYSQTRGLDGAEQCVVTARRSRLISEGG
jgi:hypothetical protein